MYPIPNNTAQHPSPNGHAPATATEVPPERSRTGKRRSSQTDLLVGYARGAELFHTPDGEPHATVTVGSHRETYPLRSRHFTRWLTRGFYLDVWQGARRAGPH